jgi:hypothetical protein
MLRPYLFNSPILPSEFRFPAGYLALVQEKELPDLQPWRFLCNDMPASLSYYGAMLQQYRDKPLIPFAMASDPSGYYNDGYVVLACFDGSDKSGDPRIYFHDYANTKRVDWPERYSMNNFAEWMVDIRTESLQCKREIEEE